MSPTFVAAYAEALTRALFAAAPRCASPFFYFLKKIT